MPGTLSLKAYLAKLDDLLRANALDEVVHHSRHILQYFPKNVATYRILGQALLANGRWNEAGDLFRRVLSVYPDDSMAHMALSDICQQGGRPKDALWHLERAYEQDPNNRVLIDALRDLYRQQRLEQTRVQLTTAAVARQYTHGGLYDQSVNTLRGALDRTPERIDLRLLLAEALWGNDQRIEAAEAALDVLDVLPDCRAANRLLTEFWLDEERPSDAQRYLNRIEAIDPYLALELAQGKPPATRADLRIDGASGDRVFLLNKGDGTVRLLVP